MKPLIFLGSCILLIFLSSFICLKNDPVSSFAESIGNYNDTTLKSWVDDFKNFRDAVYRADTAKLKSFFAFPLNTDEIWYLVLSEKEIEATSAYSQKRPSFTEKDFNKYYKKIFPPGFVKTILKIKSAELLKKTETESPEIEEKNATWHSTYKMYVTVDKKEHTLRLNLSSNSGEVDEKGEDIGEVVESNVIYTFRILKNNHLQFLKIQLAG